MYFLGDVHNQFEELASVISESDIQNDTIIQVGDFGLGILDNSKEAKQLSHLNQACVDKSVRLIVVRGNHDDPKRFDGLSSAYKNIHFACDYSLFKIEGEVVLVAGGGISIDRSLRTNLPYWKNEGFSFDESRLNNYVNQYNKIDIVITHSCPGEFWPYQFDSIVHKYAQRDEDLIVDLNRDRQEHSKLLKYLIKSNSRPQRWFYGHWHSPFTGSYADIKYQALDIFEIVELD